MNKKVNHGQDRTGAQAEQNGDNLTKECRTCKYFKASTWVCSRTPARPCYITPSTSCLMWEAK